MARSRYEYSTSPRKLQPEYNPRKREKKSNIKVVKDLPRQEVKMTKEQIKKRKNIALIVVAIFVVLLTVSYRNSQINEKFSQVQKLKKELSSIEKENEQLKVNIENSLNLNNVEKIDNRGFRILIGHSNKSFMRLLGTNALEDRKLMTTKISNQLTIKGVDILRLHL